MLLTIKAFLTIFTVSVWIGCGVSTDTKSTKVRSIVEIRQIDDKCNESDNICRGFHFGDVTEVGFFDIVPHDDSVTIDKDDKEVQQTMKFENSTFARFPLNLFYAFQLKELDMRNCSVQQIDWENFLWAVHLRILLLSNNQLQQIDELTFNYASNLEFLWLDDNQIRGLVSESFKGLKKLQYLSLHNNQLSVLPEGVFDDLVELRNLLLSQNRIQTLGNDMFQGNPNLKTVILRENHLKNISEYTFRKQAGPLLSALDISQNRQLSNFIVNLSVMHLFASNCALRQVDIYGMVRNADMSGNRILELYFSQPETLEELILQNNSLQQIASLTRANSLRVLDLSDNPQLGSLPDPWSIVSLQRLDLSNTGMTIFPSSPLAQQNQLRTLNISKNKIREIPASHFERLENLTKFYIHQNEWNCFNLKLLMDLLIKPNGMQHSVDNYDEQFPGEYINGIACMYRMMSVDDDNDEAEYLIKTKEPNTDPMVEIGDLRKELRAVVTFYEQKFSKAFEMINKLKAQINALTAQNDTLWQHVTITT